MAKKGILIVKDGTDGSGKATQTKLLVNRLRSEGRWVETIDFPRYNDNVMGKLLRECLDGKRGEFLKLDPRVTSVLYAVDRFESSRQIREWLDKGAIVVTDRYVSANMLHQGAKIDGDEERTEFLAWLDQLEHDTLGIPRPDVIIFLDMPYDVRLRLMQQDQTRTALDLAEADEMHQRSVERTAAVIRSLNSWYSISCAVDGRPRTREDIHDEIYSLVSPLLPE